ncbi:MAG: 1,4-alpha-glucan branching protein GlgB [Polyangiaceae bacterium]|nr:1,4-alpha-glucan branching protein GlgB [Polyangiaceae bacterium]
MPRSQPEFTDLDQHLFNEGTHCHLYEKMGAHVRTGPQGTTETTFRVWAPNAERVALVGSFNDWDRSAHPLSPLGATGIWETTVPRVGPGAVYKYDIASRHQGYRVQKADPYGFLHEVAPRTASVVWDLAYEWSDADWMQARKTRQGHGAPISIYEVHLGSWARISEEDNRSLGYRELADRLISHVVRLGFTHIELMPVNEHPFFGSWGYLVTGYFAPTSRYGTPQDFMYLVDRCHQAGIGVIIDWVPAHFPSDEHGLGYFDGTHLYEHADPRQGRHPDWGSLIFNYGRNEVRAFLASSALFWLGRCHIDGIRIDGVASMLYLDYSRKAGEWIPNQYGGNENLEAIALLRHINGVVYGEFPDVQTYAEESTAWPMVSRPNYVGGLGFGFKWDMGWMHDALGYFAHDSIHRKYHHHALTFRGLYAFNENFVLPLSHDEVAHGKGSLFGKMAGDEWQKFANLRLLYAYMYALSGKKLLFMGAEFGQRAEWNHDASLEWPLLDEAPHQGMMRAVTQLSRIYREQSALSELDTDPAGFEWIDANDSEASVLTFLRRGRGDACVLVALNFTPVVRQAYQVGVDRLGTWREILNTDAREFGGSGVGNFGAVDAVPVPWHGRPVSLRLTLPPLGALFLEAPPRLETALHEGPDDPDAPDPAAVDHRP